MRTALERLLEKVRETLEDLTPRARKVLVASCAGALLVLGVVLVALVLPNSRSSDDLAPEELITEVRDLVEVDLADAVLRLPPSVVRRLDDPTGLSGTLAVQDGERCVGFTLTVGEEYVLSGAQDAVQVGDVQELPQEACQNTAAPGSDGSSTGGE